MKRYKYVVAVTCLLLGAAGFVGLYMTSQTNEKQAKIQNLVEESEDLIRDSGLSGDKEDSDNENQLANNDEEDSDSENQLAGNDKEDPDNENQLADNEDEDPTIENQMASNGDSDSENHNNEAQVGKVKEEALHFNPKNGVVWPIKGKVLIDYSMDATILFPTLQQYKYSPAMVISGRVNDRVYFVAKGKITNIETNEETGCTVTQDIGDGYTAIYGQLKELNFDVGDMVESGQVVGYVSEPTKYYSVEGSNVYFQLLKDGKPVDPEEILP